MTRVDPFDLAFRAAVDERFATIRAEAEHSRRDVTDRAQFASMRSVQHLLGELEDPAAIERDPEAAEEYMAVLYAVYRYWAAGCRRVTVVRATLERALDAAPAATLPEVPSGACYFQLPERWFWGRVGADAPHEPVDGLFVAKGGHGREVSILMVLGLRANRPGFSQVSIRTTPDEVVAAHREARTPPFAPAMEGGMAAGFRSVTTAAEVLDLARICLEVWEE